MSARRSAAGTTDQPRIAMRTFSRTPRLAAALGDLATQRRVTAAPIDGKVVDAGKTLLSLVALVPIAGPYLIYRSVLHTEAEKYKLAWMSIAVMGLAAMSLVVQLPKPGKFDPGVRGKLESDFQALGAMADQYRLQHGDYPDVATWRHLADREEPSFHDPWGRPYQYERTVDGVTIRTLGRDGVNGGLGMDADLSAHLSGNGK